MDVIKQVLTDAFILKPRIFRDERGYFYESFNHKAFEKAIGKEINFIQDNQSYSSRGTIRGLHFQTGIASQSKLVRVIKGSAFDVAVDLRPDSLSFKQWYGIELNATNHLQFFIPRGFAHAFVALEDDTLFQYKVDNYYSSDHDAGIHWNDKELNITWPDLKLKSSKKDDSLPNMNQLNLNKLW